MPDRSRKHPRDINSLAASIGRDATDEDKPRLDEDHHHDDNSCITPATSVRRSLQDAPDAR